jgi:hypothetical protein
MFYYGSVLDCELAEQGRAQGLACSAVTRDVDAAPAVVASFCEHPSINNQMGIGFYYDFSGFS